MTFTGDFTGTRTLDVVPGVLVEGSTFADRYAIEGRLGAGAQSTVYSALDMLAVPPRRVALKIARAHDGHLSREAALLARIRDNPDVGGVVRLVEPSGQTFDGVEYLVLEHIDGPTLRGLVLQLRDICLLGSAIARTLALIHEANIVLADLKPENILLRSELDPVIIDFGAARQLQDSKTPHLLTPAYASPEQHAGEAPSPTSDVYALAVVLEELAGPQAPKKFATIISQAKVRNPSERPSASTFSQMLDVAHGSISRKHSGRYLWGLAAVGIFMVAILLVRMKPDFMPPNTPAIRSEKPALTQISSSGVVLYLALGETHVYWSNGDGRTVFRAPIDGRRAEIVTQLDTPAHQMSVSGQTLFIRSPDTIWTFASGQLERFAESTGRGEIVADPQNVVWTNEVTGAVVIANVRKDRPLRVLASGQNRPYSVTMDRTHVYWASEGNGTLSRVMREGGELEVLASGQLSPTGTAIDETHLYWLDRTAGQVMRIPKGGGEPQVLAKTAFGIFSSALSGTHLYWTSSDDNHVMRVPKIGGMPEVVVQGQLYVFDIVVRENDLFFSKNHVDHGGVMRLVVP